MSNSQRPTGYAPDMFSEHATLAQFGAIVRAMLRERTSTISKTGSGAQAIAGANAVVIAAIETAAKTLAIDALPERFERPAPAKLERLTDPTITKALARPAKVQQAERAELARGLFQ